MWQFPLPLTLIVKLKDNVPRFQRGCMFPHDAAVWSGLGITAAKDLHRSEPAGDWLKGTATYTVKHVHLYVNCFPAVTGANTKMNSWIRVITSSWCRWGSRDAERLNQLLKVTQLPNVRAGTLRDHFCHSGHIQFQPIQRFANGQINGSGCTLQHPETSTLITAGIRDEF